MSAPTVERIMAASPEKVWEILADGWLYPLFVVGASRMREVDDTWPEVGSRLHHSVGNWPLLLDDESVVEEAEPPTRLVLRARGWPAGEARVAFAITPVGQGSRVRLTEDAVSGPGALAPRILRHPAIAWRNTEALRRLAYLAERR